VTVDVEVHTLINRPRSEVAAFCCDPANITAWNANIATVQWNSDDPIAVGAELEFVSNFLGRRLAYTCTVTELVPDERWVMRSGRPSLLLETSYLWEDDDGGTWMTLRNRGAPTAFAGLPAPVLATALRRATAHDLDRLKLLLEAR
jgi:uncharacterized protein YndB with AHSA1/START domain